MARKLNTNLAALASAAIVAVYGVGYVQTQSAADHARLTSASAAGVATTAGPAASAAAGLTPLRTPTTAATAIARAIAATQQPASPTHALTAAASYRDGTYSGSGSSRRGDITVSLTIQQGQVTSVKITHSSTYYPISDIARLPGEVVQRQSAGVDFISGATESSRAFRGAVTQALSQARSASSAAPAPSVAPRS